MTHFQDKTKVEKVKGYRQLTSGSHPLGTCTNGQRRSGGGLPFRVSISSDSTNFIRQVKKQGRMLHLTVFCRWILYSLVLSLILWLGFIFYKLAEIQLNSLSSAFGVYFQR